MNEKNKEGAQILCQCVFEIANKKISFLGNCLFSDLCLTYYLSYYQQHSIAIRSFL
jgi:hypothetical protein